jgi:hypothetical protein
MIQMTQSSRLCTFQLLGFEVFQVRLQKRSRHFNRFYRDTQRCDFRPLEDKHVFLFSQ